MGAAKNLAVPSGGRKNHANKKDTGKDKTPRKQHGHLIRLQELNAVTLKHDKRNEENLKRRQQHKQNIVIVTPATHA